jgi:asparagine synthase (glutamine-hydrolysing)
MCGIAGVIGHDPKVVRLAIERMNEAQQHRGPDGAGIELYPFGRAFIGFGHRRLSILDVSTLGHQPMVHRPSGSSITFNGEIYNYRALRQQLEREGEVFHSGSDTEVLVAGLAKHGPDYVRQLQGMYTFGFHDPRQSSVVLARDPAGIKPLYFAQNNDYFVFASEVRAILTSGLIKNRSLSAAGIAGILAYGACQQPLTIFDAIRVHSCGAWTTIDAAESNWKVSPAHVWWTIPSPETDMEAKDVVTKTASMIEQAVTSHLVSDVPVGIFLSAGIDSAIIAGATAHQHPNIQTFTVGFEDSFADDEIQLAAATAQRVGLPNQAIRLRKEQVLFDVENWLTQADLPSMDGLNTYIISKAVRDKGIKVALSGLGADELFGGYPSFRQVPKLYWLSQLGSRVPKMARSCLPSIVGFRKSSRIKDRIADMIETPQSIHDLTLQRRRVFSNRQINGLLPRANTYGLNSNWTANEVDVDRHDAGWMISAVESRYYQTNVLLRDSDANAMAHSLEIRVPFLDQRLIDWVHRIPGRIRFPKNGSPKHLLRTAFANALDPAILKRRKTGFTLPMTDWLTGPLKKVCEQSLDAFCNLDSINANGAMHIWQNFLNNTAKNSWSAPFTLIAIGDYIRRHSC